MVMSRAAVLVRPDDAHNRALVARVHPSAWVNPEPSGRHDLVVVGAGTAGLVSAAGAAALGARVALIERHLMGGDCLNTGCVPSKALLRAARAAADVSGAIAYGVPAAAPPVPEFAAVMDRLRRIRAGIAEHDSVERFAALGVDVFLGEARFVARDAIEVGGRRLPFRRAVIATGARPATLPVPGLAEAGFLTSDTVFELTELPGRLVVIGAGPIGCELAQAFRRLGSEVSIVSLDDRVLPGADADASAVVQAQLRREGVALLLGARLLRVDRRGPAGGDKVVVFERSRGEESVGADAILVAVGRTANVEALALDAAGVAMDGRRVGVDGRLRTSNRRIYAAGDVCSPYQFTHAADAMARIVLQNALLFGRRKASSLVIPWCVYTDPEVAHVGIDDAEAAGRGADVTTLTVPLAEVDRAVVDGETDGFARIHIDRRGRILGATMVSRHAAESIGEIVLAMTQGARAGALASTIHPYPTQAEAWKRLGDAYYQRRRLTPRVRAFLGWLLRLRR